MARHLAKPIFSASLIFLLGCAVFASKSEYWLYRQLMEAEGMEKKAELYKEYIGKYPEGAYSKRLKDTEQEIEFAVYNATGQDKEKIRKYLELFPNGRFTGDARDKLAQLEAIEKMKLKEAMELQKKKEEEARKAEEKRKEYTAQITGALPDWIGISAATYVYGISVTDLAKKSQRFKALWSGEPLAQCDAETCVKSYDLSYHFKVIGATRVDRIIRMVVMMKFRKGKIWGVSVNFPGRGFIGLRELIENEPRDTTQAELEGAAGFAVDLVAATLDSIAPSGQEAEKEEYLLAYETDHANYYIVRKPLGQAGVVDSLVIQLLPQPPPEDEETPKKKKKKKKKGEEEPPEQPIIPVEKLLYMPQAPAAAPPAGVTQPPPPPGPPPAAQPPASPPPPAPPAPAAGSGPEKAPETQPPPASGAEPEPPETKDAKDAEGT